VNCLLEQYVSRFLEHPVAKLSGRQLP
jgi:hypothetical protein